MSHCSFASIAGRTMMTSTQMSLDSGSYVYELFERGSSERSCTLLTVPSPIHTLQKPPAHSLRAHAPHQNNTHISPAHPSSHLTHPLMNGTAN